jgi:hypothetical protein
MAVHEVTGMIQMPDGTQAWQCSCGAVGSSFFDPDLRDAEFGYHVGLMQWAEATAE